MEKFKLRLFGDSFRYARKRKQASKSIIIATLAILGSTILAVLIAAMFGYDPFQTIADLFSAAIVNEPDKFAYTLCVFALSAFAFSFCFKAGIFNIGISGQMYASGVAVLAFSRAIGDSMPDGLGQILALIIAMLVGSLVALLTGALERYFKVDAVVSAIILNWIILFIGFFIIAQYYPNNDNLAQMTSSLPIPEHFILNSPNFPGWASSLIIVALIAIILLVLTKYTVFGHKINSTGLSIEGSRYAGYNVAAIKLSTFAISGAISGVLAMVLYTAYVPCVPATILNVVVPVEGFNGIAVGLIAGNNPIGIIAVSAIIGLFQTSASYLPMEATFSSVIIGLVMLGAAITVVFYKYRPYVWYLKKRYGMDIDKAYTDYENKTDSLISKYKSIYSVYMKDQKNLKEAAAKGMNRSDVVLECNFKSIAEIEAHYLEDIQAIKNEYKKQSIIEAMTLKLHPAKFIAQSEEKIINEYDTKLTKYVSKQRSKIERNNELIEKSNPNKGMDSFLIQWLKGDNEKKSEKITSSIQQNTSWKNKDIEKKKAKLTKSFNTNNTNLDLNANTITTFEAIDARLNKINKNAIKSINKKIVDATSKNELLEMLANFNNQIYKNGGTL